MIAYIDQHKNRFGVEPAGSKNRFAPKRIAVDGSDE